MIAPSDRLQREHDLVAQLRHQVRRQSEQIGEDQPDCPGLLRQILRWLGGMSNV
jgi:hypothetical protein